MLNETSCLRDNIWPEHVRIINRNIKAGQTSCWIFEIGNIFQGTDYIDQKKEVGIALPLAQTKYDPFL